MTKPRLLDTFCKAGGAGHGYALAGFDVTGVDIEPQPRYPYAFIQGDAIEYIRQRGGEYDAIHASPPCQDYSNAKKIRGNEHPRLIEPTRAALLATGKPYIIENVPGAPLRSPVTLVGTMFGLRTLRPRLFECSFPVPFRLAPPPNARTAKMGRKPKPGEYMHVVGHISDVEQGRRAMGIDWMTRDELAQAIPPDYTRYLGEHLLAYLGREIVK